MVGRMKALFLLALVLATILVLTPTPAAHITPVSAEGIITMKVTANPQEIEPGQASTITISVTPTYSINDTQLVIYVNGVEYSVVDLGNLAANSTVTYQFSFTPHEPGYFLVTAELRQEVYK